MSSEDNETFSEPTMWVLIGSVVTAALAGISWCVQKRCRRTHFAINSGCLECSADSEKLRMTIREEIHAERQERESKSEEKEGDFVLESPKQVEGHTSIEIVPVPRVNPQTPPKSKNSSG